MERVIFDTGTMIARPKLSARQHKAMLEMLAGLTPAERQTLTDPDFITEDEADLIYCERAMSEPGPSIPAEDVFAELGIPFPRGRLTA